MSELSAEKLRGLVAKASNPDNASPLAGGTLASYLMLHASAIADALERCERLEKALAAYVDDHNSIQDTMYSAIAESPEGGWKCGCNFCKAARDALTQPEGERQ